MDNKSTEEWLRHIDSKLDKLTDKQDKLNDSLHLFKLDASSRLTKIETEREGSKKTGHMVLSAVVSACVSAISHFWGASK